MCGFAGFHSPRNFPPDADLLARKMADKLRSRGPDGTGDWSAPSLGTALAFRRLAIVDLSDLGHQPMISADGRFVLTINGELYNHRILRAELEQRGHHFRGTSDTEVLLEAISAWGFEASLRRSIGMFAITLVDVQERQLLLARDRLGEKPLYYGWSNNHFFFGSELKAFRPHPGFTPEVDRRALALYLRHGYVPSPHSILKGFHKLLPGHILSLDLDGTASPGKETLKCYWSLRKPGAEGRFESSPEDYVNKLEELLREAIQMQMLADVPVGAFLSGGIDSSTVVSLMQSHSATPVKTFCIGFPDARFDESDHAARIAVHLGTDHTTWRCVDSELLGLVNQIPDAYSEPFADDSVLPSMALARLARQQVTVCLSGDGGDELFLGYERYYVSLRRWGQINRHPEVRSLVELGINTLSSLTKLLIQSPLRRRCLSQLSRARKQWVPQNLPALYAYRMAMIKPPDLYLNRFGPVGEFFDDSAQMGMLGDNLNSMSYLDLHRYLPDDILAKVDRAAMAFSLETRMPLLDHRVVEYAMQMPEQLKVWEGKAKWPLRQILNRRVPRNLTERGKMGFSSPTARWLRGPLREWAEAKLAGDRLRREGFFDTGELCRVWKQHKQGKRDRGNMLWTFLMFQAWYDSF
jgi:asparagine synthase (glutamine-hydrolysing)